MAIAAQARQRAELNATDAEEKLKAYVWAADPRNGEGAQGEGQQAKAMADLDASLMQRLDEDSATNHRLFDSLRAAQVWVSWCMHLTMRCLLLCSCCCCGCSCIPADPSCSNESVTANRYNSDCGQGVTADIAWSVKLEAMQRSQLLCLQTKA